MRFGTWQGRRQRAAWVLLLALALVLGPAAAPARAGEKPGASRGRAGEKWGAGWKGLSTKERDKAQRKFEIFERMPPERRREIRENYREWSRMPPSKRKEIRRNYEAYRDLSPSERRRLGELFERRKAMGTPGEDKKR
jgi:acyl-CoA-binding protein